VNFLALSPQAAYALLASVALLIVMMYWLKRRPVRIRVASTLIWRTLQKTARRSARGRWRWWLSLLLALSTGLSMALALTRPQAPALGGIGQRLVLVLDNSPSMAARGEDRVSRWDHAVERARRMISNAGLASEIMVLDTMGRTDTPEWVSRKTALTQLSGLAPGTYGAGRMPLIPAGEHIEAHLLTDGVARLDLAPHIEVESVFATADNVAITAFDAKPSLQDPTRYQALVQVFNGSVRAKHVRFTLTDEKGIALERDLNLSAGVTLNQSRAANLPLAAARRCIDRGQAGAISHWRRLRRQCVRSFRTGRVAGARRVAGIPTQRDKPGHYALGRVPSARAQRIVARRASATCRAGSDFSARHANGCGTGFGLERGCAGRGQ
jgi:hypothetical protein